MTLTEVCLSVLALAALAAAVGIVLIAVPVYRASRETALLIQWINASRPRLEGILQRGEDVSEDVRQIAAATREAAVPVLQGVTRVAEGSRSVFTFVKGLRKTLFTRNGHPGKE